MAEPGADVNDRGEDVNDRAEQRVGSVLKDKWTIDALLAIGGMAAVYSATHRNRSRAAVKVLHLEYSTNSEMRARFLREGYLANSVGHPGAVRVEDDDIAEDGSAFLVEELLEGEALDERCERKGGHLPVNEVLAVADQLLDVLAVAHDKGIVHRDLKPENLFLTHSGVLKVLDFGIARLDALSTSSSTTRAGALLGTPAFMAPEQARGRWEEVDARTDLWAVGATMFSLLTGRMVHDAETPNEALALAITQPPPPISQLLPDLHVCVAALVDRALRYCKDERFQNAREMQQAVCQAYGEVSAAAPARPPMPSIYDSGIRCVDARGADGDVLPSALVNRVSGMVTTVTLASSAARSGSTSLTPRSTRSRAWGVIARTALIVAVVGVAAYRGGSRDGEAKARAQESSKGLPQAAGQSEKHMSVSAGTSPVVREAASTSNPANCQGVTSVQFAPGGAGADAPSAGAREQGAAPRKRAARAAGVAEDPFAKRH